jgi:pimeloyl-ACP methyl ester carboxylesterase
VFAKGSARSADGTQIVFQRGGSGPSVLIVHGTLATSAMYLPIAELLSQHYQVTLVERRGYGISGSGTRPATFARQAEDIAAVLGALGEPSHVFGHSCGGLVTLHAAAIAAASIRSVALYEPPAALAGDALAAARDQCRALVRAVGDNVSAASVRPLAALFAGRAAGMVADLECMTAMPAGPDSWPAVTMPVLLLAGERTDGHARRSLAMLRESLPVLDTTTLAGQGHHPEDPDLVAAALHAFFTRH